MGLDHSGPVVTATAAGSEVPATTVPVIPGVAVGDTEVVASRIGIIVLRRRHVTRRWRPLDAVPIAIDLDPQAMVSTSHNEEQWAP